MCLFEHPYEGFFEDDVTRRVAVVGVMLVEVLDRAVLACIAAIEYSSAVREILSIRITAIVLSALIFVLFSLLHCLLFRGPRLLCAQMPLVSIAHVSWVVFLLSVLAATKTEGWEPRGFVTSCFLAIAAIKLCGVAIACFGLVDMSSDWGYLVELIFGVVLLVIGVVLMQMLPNNPFPLTWTFSGVVAIIISTLSLLDLHQNMSINSWWWEERLLEGCVYQVIRQYTLTCCVRVEEAPSILMEVDGSSQDEGGRTREAATSTNPP